MGLTRIDCHVYRGEEASTEESSFVLFNPRRQPANVVFVGARAARDGIGSQVAFRLALEHFAEAVSECYAEQASLPDAVTVLEAGFRAANQGVYSFGHKLAAGGRLAASVVGAVLAGSQLAVGRVGLGSAYLYRDGHLYPFFEEVEGRGIIEEESVDNAAPAVVKTLSFIGMNSLVDVELSSVPLLAGDLFVLFSRPLSEERLPLIMTGLESLATDEEIEAVLPREAEALFQSVFDTADSLSYGFIAHVGPEAIYLAEVAGG